MTGIFLLLAVANAVVAALITWAIGRRFGVRACLIVPVLGTVAAVAMTWRNSAPENAGLNLEVLSAALLITWPWLVGALAGLLLTRWRRGR